MNNIREKIILLLLGGIAFGCSYTPGKQWTVLRAVSKEWKRINERELREGISYLYRLGYIDKKQGKSNINRIVLTKKGKLKSLSFRLDNIRRKKVKWDKKWRMVAFDIPERYKKGRDTLRRKLKDIGFVELQKSVLVTPYDCEEDIKALIDFFELKKYVCFGILDSVDNNEHLKKLFKLL